MLGLKRFRRLNQSGDTIVEVLIAIAVVSLVLSAAYAITNRNVASDQDTQEHNVAQRIAQSQIELLRSLAQSDVPEDKTMLADLDGGCIVVSNGLSVVNDSDICTFKKDGRTTPCTEQPCYQTSVEPNPTTGIYTIRVQWPNLHGETSQLSMEYGV